MAVEQSAVDTQSAEITKAIWNLPAHKSAAVLSRLSWLSKARPTQIPPHTDWFAFLALSGRGWGKTRVCSEDSWWYCAWNDGVRLAVVAPTNSDIQKTVFEGESGLRAVCPVAVLDGGRFDTAYNKGTKELKFANGSIIQGFSSESYERLRGPQFHRAWCEELAAWPYPQETWDMLMFGLRLGERPRAVISTTPKPLKLVKHLAGREDVHKVFGSTYDNEANLAPSFLEIVRQRYEGTRLGRQEIRGEILDAPPGALWTWGMIERARYMGALPEWTYRIVSIDPSVGDGTPGSDECGIVVCALGKDGFGYVLADRSLCGPPQQWGKVAVEAYRQFGCNWVIGEVNNGGKMIEGTIHAIDPTVPFREVRASKGKRIRAEPVSMLYEQSKIRHTGVFEQLESQLTEWSPQLSNDSPDRLDALVWGFTKLMVESAPGFFCGIA